jgi:drug/metabolite transporter (DMT)-like permease
MKDEKSNAISYAIVFHFLLGIMNFVFSILFNGFQTPSLDRNLIKILLAALLWGGATIFLFKALKLVESSEVTILSTIRVVVTIIFSVLFVHEVFNKQRVLGAILIIIATILVTQLKKGMKLNRGMIYILIMSILSGVAIIFDGLNVEIYDVVSYNSVVNFTIGLLLLISNPISLRGKKYLLEFNFLNKMLPLALFSTIQGIAYLLALDRGGDISQVGTIRQAQVIVTVIFAVIFLNERSRLVLKLVSAALVTLGVILLS